MHRFQCKSIKKRSIAVFVYSSIYARLHNRALFETEKMVWEGASVEHIKENSFGTERETGAYERSEERPA